MSESKKSCSLCKYRKVPQVAEPCLECCREGGGDRWEPEEPTPDLPALLARCKKWIEWARYGSADTWNPETNSELETLLAEIAEAGVK